MKKVFKNGVRILSLEAKDIYIANIYNNDGIGYNPRYKSGELEGQLNSRKFVNVLGNSLELNKLAETYKRIIRRNDFYQFVKNDNHNIYTTEVINVKFTFNVKEFNKINKETYIKVGYNCDSLTFKNGLAWHKNEIVGINTNDYVFEPVDSSLLPTGVKLVDNHYVVGELKEIANTTELRKWIYTNGFYCDGKKYSRYKRSNGASRQGKCLFINSRLKPALKKWSDCGLKFRRDEVVDLASLEAYIPLTLSEIIDEIEIEPENILVIDDYESVFKDSVVYVDMYGGMLRTRDIEEIELKNSIWDGQSLIDISIMGKYSNKGMLLLRNLFFKTCAFNANIQDWFEDNDITEIEQLNGFTIAKSVKDIKLITTPSSIKYCKFGEIKTWLEHIEPNFGIVKHEKKTHYFDGKMVKTHYQLLNTVKLSKEETYQLLKPSIDYMNMLKLDPAVFKQYIKFQLDSAPEEEILSNTHIVYKMMNINDSFTNTKVYRTFRDETIKSFKTKMRKGKVLINGNYSTILGNPIEMLQQSIGTFNGKSYMGVGNISNKNFDYNTKLLGCRSPHIAPSNILIASNKQYDLIDEYINMSTEIVAINSIGENILQRLNGCDFDSDTILLTDNKILVDAAIKNYHAFKVPTSGVNSIKVKRHYNDADRCDLDVKTGNNKIGEIVNLAQEILTLMWDHISKNGFDKKVYNYFTDVCKLSVLSGIEIDSAKKEFSVNTGSELKKIKSKYFATNDDRYKPMFFKTILTQKGFDISNTKFKNYNTTMDFVHSILNATRLKKDKNEIVPFSSILDCEGVRETRGRIEKFEYIKNEMSQMRKEITSVWLSGEAYSYDEKLVKIEDIKYKHRDRLLSIKLNLNDCRYILKKFDNKESFRRFYMYAFNYLFNNEDSIFYLVLEESKSDIEFVEYDSNGEIELFDIKVSKIYKKPYKS
mgnify:CR=1 FL=1